MVEIKDVGVAYCLITIVRLVAMGIHRHVRRDFDDTELAIARTLSWPVTDALWLARRWRAWWAAGALVVAWAPLDGCAYRDYLDSLPVTERARTGEAVAIVAEVYGIDYRAPEIKWIVQDEPLISEDGNPALGVSNQCTCWVWWPPSLGPDPESSPAFGATALAHEIAHCALWLYRSDPDPDHSDDEWWGPDGESGLVAIANDELMERGL